MAKRKEDEVVKGPEVITLINPYTGKPGKAQRHSEDHVTFLDGSIVQGDEAKNLKPAD